MKNFELDASLQNPVAGPGDQAEQGPTTQDLAISNTDEPCPVCHGGRKQPGTTTFAVDLGFGVVVRDVPAQVCDLCGTDWVDDATAETLEQIVEQARRRHPVVEVASWNDQLKTLAG